MKKTYFTPEGKITKELTIEELETEAERGDETARKELCKLKMSLAKTLQEEIDIIKELLGL